MKLDLNAITLKTPKIIIKPVLVTLISSVIFSLLYSVHVSNENPEFGEAVVSFDDKALFRWHFDDNPVELGIVVKNTKNFTNEFSLYTDTEQLNGLNNPIVKTECFPIQVNENQEKIWNYSKSLGVGDYQIYVQPMEGSNCSGTQAGDSISQNFVVQPIINFYTILVALGSMLSGVGAIIAVVFQISNNKSTIRAMRDQADANLKQMERQIDISTQALGLTKKEMESKLKAELVLEEPFTNIRQENLGEGKMVYTGEFEAKLHNTGILTAENIRVYHSDPQKSSNLNEIVGDEENIKEKLIRVKGNILQDGTVQIQKIEIPLKTRDPFTFAIWIIYDDSEVKNRESIYVFYIKGTRNYEQSGPFSKSQIEQARKN